MEYDMPEMDYDETDLNNILNDLNAIGIKVDIPPESIDTTEIPIFYKSLDDSPIKLATFASIKDAYQCLHCMSVSYYALRDKILNFLFFS